MYYYKQNIKKIDKDTSKILYLLFKYSYKYYNKLLNNKVNKCPIIKDKLEKTLGSFLCKSIAGNLNINYTNHLKSKGDFKKPEFRYKEKEFFLAFFGSSFKIEKDLVYLTLNKKKICFKIANNCFETIKNMKDVRMIRLHKTSIKDDYYLVFEYNKSVAPTSYSGKKFHAGLDLGMNNLITIYSDNEASKPLILSGKYIKFINYKYANIMRNLDLKRDYTLVQKLYKKRQNTIKYFFNKACKRLFDYLKYYNIGTLYVGDFHGVKDKKVASNFYNISYFVLNKKLKDYAKKNGIRIEFIREDFTSKTSFLDYEKPERNFKKEYVGERVFRGLFVTKNGHKVNADVNGAAQILSKKIYVQNRSTILKKPFYINLIVKKTS